MVLRFLSSTDSLVPKKAVESAEKNIKSFENINKKFNKCKIEKPFVVTLFLQCPLYRERFTEKGCLGPKRLSALLNVRFMVVRLIESFLKEFNLKWRQINKFY